jgi:predicted nucleotidyltransferase
MFQEASLSEDFIKVHQFLLKNKAEREQELFKTAWSYVQKVAEMIKTKYRVKDIFLYGSLAWGGFTEHSDLDLFLVGFQGKYWDMLLEAERLSRPFVVSIVCEEDASSSLKKEVLRKGIPL